MKNIAIGMVAFAGIVLIGFIGLTNYLYTENPGGPGLGQDLSTFAPYFQSELIRRGVEDIGQPIEGFDAGLLMAAFPGLTPADFDRVEAFEGYYLAPEGQLEFVREPQGPVTSAERTISDKGYETLIENLAERFHYPIVTEAQVDDLINRIDTDE